MYSRKSVDQEKSLKEQQHESDEDYSSRTTRKRVLLRKEKIRPSI